MKLFLGGFGALVGLGTISIVGYIVVTMSSETRAVVLVGGALLVGFAVFTLVWKLLSLYGETRKPQGTGTVPMLAPQHQMPPIIVVGGALSHPQQQPPVLPQPATVDWANQGPPVDLNSIFVPLEGDEP